MIVHIIRLFFIISIFALTSCANKENLDLEQTSIGLPEEEYIEAKLLLDDDKFDEALASFNKIEKKYPLSNWAIKSKIMIIFIDYLKLDYENASLKIEKFIIKYPDYKDIDYVYYLRALTAYEQIKNPELDTSNTMKSQKYFEELIRRFPQSKYSKDGMQKIILIKTVLAGKDMHVGLYYLEQKKYLAALNRFQKIVDNYEPNRYTPEALHRIVEIYYTLGMINDAERITAILGYNYPESIWYKRSYKIVGKKNEETNEDLSLGKKLLKKIF